MQWDLRGNPSTDDEEDRALATPVSYRVTLTVVGREYARVTVVEEDVRMHERE